MQKLSQLIRGNELIVAPVALNPIMARMAEEAGFKAVYMSGGSQRRGNAHRRSRRSRHPRADPTMNRAHGCCAGCATAEPPQPR